MAVAFWWCGVFVFDLLHMVVRAGQDALVLQVGLWRSFITLQQVTLLPDAMMKPARWYLLSDETRRIRDAAAGTLFVNASRKWAILAWVAASGGIWSFICFLSATPLLLWLFDRKRLRLSRLLGTMPVETILLVLGISIIGDLGMVAYWWMAGMVAGMSLPLGSCILAHAVATAGASVIPITTGDHAARIGVFGLLIYTHGGSPGQIALFVAVMESRQLSHYGLSVLANIGKGGAALKRWRTERGL